MNNIKQSFLLSICAITVVLLSVSSCKTDYRAPDKDGIFGTWKTYNNLTQVLRSVTFKEDSTSVYTSSKVDNQGRFLYDFYRKEAMFSLKSTAPQKLTFYNTVTYLNQDYENSSDKNAYVQTGQQNMVASPGTTTTVHSFMLNDGKMNFSWECSGTSTPTCYVAVGEYRKQ